ncbi:head GIN domain-containing protein [Candidatus Neomarinimicrobiota bacterium]
MKVINRFIPIILLILLIGCSIVDAQSTEIRTFSRIDRVALLGSGDVNITLGDKEEITIHAPADLIPYLLTENKDGTLQIGKRKKGWKNFFRFNDHVHYDLIVKQISDISVSGSGDIDSEKLFGEKCSVKVSGSGNIEVDQINSKGVKVTVSGSGDIGIDNLSTDELVVSINGSGDIDINGRSDELEGTISGSGDFTGDEMRSKNVSINIYGSGNASVYATESLEVHISGSGDVTYHGNPTVNSRVTGSGDIRHR